MNEQVPSNEKVSTEYALAPAQYGWLHIPDAWKGTDTPAWVPLGEYMKLQRALKQKSEQISRLQDAVESYQAGTPERASNEPADEPVAWMSSLNPGLVTTIRHEGVNSNWVPLYRAAQPPSPDDVRDAERYRWLRTGNDYERIGPMVVLCEADHSKNDHRPFWSLAESALDAAVDKARATATKEAG